MKILKIYPNPTSEIVYIKLIYDDNYTVSLYNILGELVLEKLQSICQINIKDLPSGQYILKIKSENVTINERILKF